MFKSTLLALASAAAVVTTLGLAAGSASAQGGPDWRRGTFEQRPGAHRYGQRCIVRHVATGFAPVSFFGGGQGVRKAEARAVRSWENRVNEQHGPQFASFARAQGKQNRCIKKGLEIECIISAHPCRG